MSRDANRCAVCYGPVSYDGEGHDADCVFAQRDALAAENERLRSQLAALTSMCDDAQAEAIRAQKERDEAEAKLAALTPKPERFDPTEICTATRHGFAYVPGCCCEKLRLAHQRGWKDAPENDRAQVERLIKVRDEQRERIAGLEEALTNAIEAIRLGLIEGECQEVDSENPEPCGTWHDTANGILRQCRTALASPPKPESCFGEWDTTDCEIQPGDPNASHWLIRRDLPVLRADQRCLRCGGVPSEHHPEPKPAAGEQPKSPETFPVPGAKCRCGSGAHPRRCLLHPDYFDKHVAEINVANAEIPAEEPKSDAGPCAACDEAGEAEWCVGPGLRCERWSTGREPSGGGA